MISPNHSRSAASVRILQRKILCKFIDTEIRYTNSGKRRSHTKPADGRMDCGTLSVGVFSFEPQTDVATKMRGKTLHEKHACKRSGPTTWAACNLRRWHSPMPRLKVRRLWRLVKLAQILLRGHALPAAITELNVYGDVRPPVQEFHPTIPHEKGIPVEHARCAS